MNEHQGASFRRPAALTIGAAAMGFVTAGISIVAHPSAANAVDYPSWTDVQQAKSDVKAQQAMVDRIDGIVAGLQSAASSAGLQSEMALEQYHESQADLDAATQHADDLKKQADAADTKATTSSVRAGLLASHLMRAAGTDGSLGLLLHGNDGKAADTLLYQLGTMSQLTAQSKRIYNEAIADRNTSQSLADQAKAAEKERKKAADAAQSAYQAAQVAAAAAQAAVTTQQQKQSELTSQLASLKNISTQKAKEYVAGQQAAAQARAEAAARKKAQEEAAAQAKAERAAAAQAQAEQAAAAQAAERRAAEQRAQQQSSGSGSSASSGSSGSSASSGSSGSTSSSGGSSSSGGGSSAATPATPPVTTAAPNSSIAAAAIAYARAQLGKPYIFAGSGPTGFDCSGLTLMAYAYAGVSIGGHGVGMQYRQAAALGQLVPRSQAQPGDLIFWGTAPYNLYHVGIYLGGGMMIAAPQVGDVVKIQAVWGSPIDVVARPSIGH